MSAPCVDFSDGPADLPVMEISSVLAGAWTTGCTPHITTSIDSSNYMPALRTSGISLGESELAGPPTSGLFNHAAAWSTKRVDISIATLADAAQARQGLLFMLGGNVSRAACLNYPTSLNFDFAVVLNLLPSECDDAHRLVVTVQDSDGRKLGEVRDNVAITITGPIDEGERVLHPVALSLRQIAIPGPGRYTAALEVNGEKRAVHDFKIYRPDVVERPSE